jgi:phage regulator Rha-like protein
MANNSIAVVQRGSQLVVDSRLVAADLGIKHKNFLETIRKYQKDLEEFGEVPFQTAVESKSNNPEVFCWLTEEQATFAMTLSRNSAKVIECKKKLTRWFYAAKKLLQQRRNAEWIEARDAGKRNRRQETDGIKAFIEYAKAQGSQNAEKYYANLTKMENKALFLVEQKYPNLRDVLGVAELGLIAVADVIVLNALKDGMAQVLHYKDIYKLAKQRVETLGAAHGKVLVPSGSEKSLQHDQSPRSVGILNL